MVVRFILMLIRKLTKIFLLAIAAAIIVVIVALYSHGLGDIFFNFS